MCTIWCPMCAVLRPGSSAWDLLRATFPGGTIADVPRSLHADHCRTGACGRGALLPVRWAMSVLMAVPISIS